MSPARRLSVLPSVMNSVRLLGTRVEVRPAGSDTMSATAAPRYARGGQCVDVGLHQGLTADFVGIAVGVG